MKSWRSYVLATVLLTTPASLLSQEDLAPNWSIEEAIAKLSDESFEVREQASHYLWGKGRKTLSQIQAFQDHEDPEISSRVRRIIRNLNIGLLPNTPLEVMQLTDRYQGSSRQEKKTIFEKLKKLGAHKPLLYLYSLESSQKTKDALAKSVIDVAKIAVNEALLAGDNMEAIELLRLAPRDEKIMMLLANLYRKEDLLDEQIKLAQKSKDSGAARWELSLLLAKSDYEAAITLAKKLDEKQIVTALSLLKGDPLPYLEQAQDASVSGPWVTWYVETAKANWESKDDSEWIEKIVEDVSADSDIGSKGDVCSVLFLVGQTEKAFELMRDSDPMMEFQYYESGENIDSALTTLGIKSKEEASTWALEQLDAVGEKINSANSIEVLSRKVISLAHLFYSRGDIQTGLAILKEPLDRLYKADKEKWLQVIEFLTRLEGAKLVNQYLNEKEKDVPGCSDQFIALYTDGNVSRSKVFQLFKTIKPDAKIEDYMYLMGQLPSKNKEIEQLENLLYAEISKRPENEISSYKLAMSYLAVDRGNLLEGAKRFKEAGLVDEKLLDQKLALQVWYRHISIESEDLEFMMPLWEDQYERNKDNPLALLQYGAGLRIMGHHEEAVRLMDFADTLSLSNEKWLAEIVGLYIEFGERERAYNYMKNQLAINGLQSSTFNKIFFETISELAYKLGHYKEAAAFYEVLAHHTAENASFPSVGRDDLKKDHRATLFNEIRGRVYLCRGLHALQSDRNAEGLSDIKKAFVCFLYHSGLADEFFPVVRNKIPRADYDAMFAQSIAPLEQTLRDYPSCENLHNSYAWLSSRAMKNLQKAQESIDFALSVRPNEGAYLDTKAEVEFASYRRKQAVNYSNKALLGGGMDKVIWEQNRRFKFGEFPDPLK